MLNMMFLMIPYGAVIAYSSILAQEKGLMEFLPYFYICLVVGMPASKLSTQKLIDAGSHRLCGGRHRLWNICRPLLSQAQARSRKHLREKFLTLPPQKTAKRRVKSSILLAVFPGSDTFSVDPRPSFHSFSAAGFQLSAQGQRLL